MAEWQGASSDLQLALLNALRDSDTPVLSGHILPSIAPTAVKSALDSLKSRQMLAYTQIEREECVLTPEGEGIVRDGSHEAKVFEAVRAAVEGLKIDDLPVCWLSFTPA